MVLNIVDFFNDVRQTNVKIMSLYRTNSLTFGVKC